MIVSLVPEILINLVTVLLQKTTFNSKGLTRGILCVIDLCYFIEPDLELLLTRRSITIHL